jgi:hypothetical protein
MAFLSAWMLAGPNFNATSIWLNIRSSPLYFLFGQDSAPGLKSDSEVDALGYVSQKDFSAKVKLSSPTISCMVFKNPYTLFKPAESNNNCNNQPSVHEGTD